MIDITIIVIGPKTEERIGTVLVSEFTHLSYF